MGLCLDDVQREREGNQPFSGILVFSSTMQAEDWHLTKVSETCQLPGSQVRAISGLVLFGSAQQVTDQEAEDNARRGEERLFFHQLV